MRRGPEVSGWVGSLFPEPIDQVKVPSDRCICHQDCPQYETCETEALDKSSKVYYLLRCVKGKFPACANCMCMACDRYHECMDGPEMGQPGGTRYRMCNRPISITGCPDYSGSIPWKSEAACKKCDHVCDLRKDLIWAPRVRCDEPAKKPTEEPSAVQLDGKPTVEHPTLIRYGHETWRQYELEGRLVEEFVSTDRPVRKESEFAADMVAVDAARKAAGDLPSARSFVEKGIRGIRIYEDPELQHRVPRVECIHKLASQGNGGLCAGCSERKGEPCKYSRVVEAEPAVEVPAAPTKLTEWILSNCGKHHTCRDDCAGRGGGLCPFTVSREGGIPADLLEDRAKDDAEAKAAKKAPKAKKPAKLKSADYNGNALPGSNADICSHCDCETCGLNQAHLDYTDKTWKDCPPCGCDQCLGKDELQPKTLCGRKAALTAEVMGNTESCLPREQLHVDTVQRYVRPAECAEGSCTACQCQTCGNRNLNCALNGDEPVLICSTCWLNHPHHWKVYAAIVKKCPHWRDAETFPADILAPGMGPCPEIACQLMYNGEGGPCLCHSCKYGPGSCDTSCNIPGYPMETGQYACEWYDKKEVATNEVVALPAADLDVPDLVKVGDLVTRLHARGYIYEIRKVTRVEKTDAGWQIYGDLWDDFRHPKRKKVSKNEPIIRYGVTGWKVEDGKVVPLGQKVVEDTFGAMYNETYADERLITLTLEQVEQLVAVEEAEDVSGPTWYTHVWLKPAGSKGHKNEQGYLEDPRKRWPLLGHARFVDTSAAAVAKIPSGRRAEVCQDEPECETCHCHTCQHQKDCRLDNTLNCCSPCKTSGGAHHHKAVDCEGHVTLEDVVQVVDRSADGC